ncbi:hypothetical protein OFC56_31680, partial [Escherichia coli]|nr:hypothetical protein [Escherichia coli]
CAKHYGWAIKERFFKYQRKFPRRILDYRAVTVQAVNKLLSLAHLMLGAHAGRATLCGRLERALNTNPVEEPVLPPLTATPGPCRVNIYDVFM